MIEQSSNRIGSEVLGLLQNIFKSRRAGNSRLALENDDRVSRRAGIQHVVHKAAADSKLKLVAAPKTDCGKSRNSLHEKHGLEVSSVALLQPLCFEACREKDAWLVTPAW